ncbi:MAG: hypothetical protein M3Q44_03805 [bacterium]|nr:hypothetical protein [bacterium]
MRIAAGVVGVLLVLAVIYFFLPAGAKRVVNPFYRGSTVVTRTSPSPSSRANVSSDAPDSFLNTTNRPSSTAVALASATVRATTSPRPSATGTVNPLATVNPSATGTATTTAALPGTGDQERNPELLVIQMLASVLIIMFGYKLSKHI